MNSYHLPAPISPYIIFITVLSCGLTASSQKRAPDFAFVSLDDTARMISNEQLAGKIYLLDFWATWCPPCVEEVPYLSKAYKKYKGKNFEIISLSFDDSREKVMKFRERKYSMPWIHGLVTRGFGDHLAQEFDVENIPRQILIDTEGYIIAEDDALRGEHLETTLAIYVK